MQLPCVTPYPGPRSVIVMDNCSTHKSQAVREVIEAAGEFIEILKWIVVDSLQVVISFFSRHILPIIALSRKALIMVSVVP